MKKLLVLGIISIFLSILGFVITKQAPQPKKLQSLTPQQLKRIPREVNGIPAAWHIYQSDLNGFIIKHPVDVIAEITTEGDRFYKLGETQSMGTELYDGISLVIRSGKMNGGNFKEFVTEQYTTTKKDSTTQSISEIKPLTIAGKEGYTYHLSSLGERQIIYLPKGNNGYLQIINGTVQPQNQTRDFQKIVTMMLSSLEFPSDQQTIQPIIEQ